MSRAAVPACDEWIDQGRQCLCGSAHRRRMRRERRARWLLFTRAGGLVLSATDAGEAGPYRIHAFPRLASLWRERAGPWYLDSLPDRGRMRGGVTHKASSIREIFGGRV